MDWTTFQRQSYYLIRLLFPYVSDMVHRAYRRKHFKDVSTQMFTTFDMSFWEDVSGRTVRLSCDQKDCQLAYVDFLDFTYNKNNYKGPHLPMNLMLAGNGTLSTPYRVNFTQDPLAKSLVFLNK